MNGLSRFLSALAPVRSLRRAQARFMLRRWEAAEPSRLRSM